MLETSTDLLFIALAFSVLWITLFLCWGLYYMISIMRNASKIIVSVREKLELVDNILKLIKDKLESGSNHMAILSDSAIKLVGFLIEKNKKDAASPKKKAAKKK